MGRLVYIRFFKLNILILLSYNKNMNIAFCDDDELLLNKLMTIVKDIIDKHNVYNFEFDYYKYSSPGKFLKASKKILFDVAFIDIEMPAQDGLSVGDMMYETNENIFIFYVTSHSQYISQSIKHRVYRFIRKDDLSELNEGIQSMFNDLTVRKARYVFSYKKNNYALPMTKIYYFESRKNLIDIVTENGTFSQRITIKELVDTLPNFFCRCHSSFIVNLLKIKEIDNNNIILDNDEIIPLARNYADITKSRFFDSLL